jgi:EmrB/QacA subfamily drug resistance transporter
MVIIGALMMVMLLAALDQTIVSTALPRIASDLHGLNKLSWVATAYLLTSAITTLIYGKISDQVGRKKIFQTAIVIFLFGSVLCGISQTMTELIFARGLQGIGAGGLISLVLAIVGDIVPPRQRGRYMGYIMSVFAVASVAGPLIGGFLTDSLSWRWVFFVNLPIGAVALTAVATRLHLPVHKSQHRIDYLGSALMAASSISLILASVWAGVKYTWGSPQIIGLLTAFVVLAVAFILHERRAKEPIMPLHLFKNDIFSVSVALSILAGIAMFATILYIPLYQQIVRGYSPTKSGLYILPLVGGLMFASITSGRLTTRLGKYRIFPIFGTAVLALGIWLFSHLSLTTSTATLSLWMVIIGVGLGSFMQIMTLAIQNSVDRREMGTATSSATFFRSLGSSLGGAIFGSILISRLTHNLSHTLPAGVKINAGALESGSSSLQKLPAAAARPVDMAFVQAFHYMFLLVVPVVLLAFVISLFLREAPLRSSNSQEQASAIE